MKKRFERGDFAIGLSNEFGEPLSYLFLSNDVVIFSQVGIKLTLPNNCFGIYDVYTYPNGRGKGFYKHLFYYSIAYMKKQGYHKLWLWLMAHNKVSVIVHSNFGISRISKILTKKNRLVFVCKKIENVDMHLEELLIK
jgi:GNAT superfamily N-acetyltransferase